MAYKITSDWSRTPIASGTTFNISQVGTYNISNSSFNGSGRIVLSTNGATVNLNSNNTVSSNMEQVTVGGTLNINQGISIARLKTNTINNPVISVCSANTLTITDNLTNESVGTIKGIGNVYLIPSTATFTNTGIISPGCSPGTLTIQGNIATGATGTLAYEIMETAGAVPRDLLQINGTLTLGGTLNIAHVSGTVPAGTYDIATCNGGPNCLTGTFSTINYPPGCNGNCTVTYTGTSASLVATAPIAMPPLPLELLSFTAQATHRTNLLTWQTATEKNVRAHIIERSPEGQHWNEVGRQAGQLHTQGPTKYTLDDPQPLSRTYYRLRSLDVDGTQSISKVIVVERDGEKFGIQSVAPNPASEQVTVQFTALEEGTVRLKIVDITGKLVHQETLEAKSGWNTALLSVNRLPSGVYQLLLGNSHEMAAPVQMVKE